MTERRRLTDEEIDDIMARRRYHQSELYWQRAKKVIPGGTQTLSKGPDRFVDGAFPKFLAVGEGSHVWDVDGNEYIDYPCALGAIILGYNVPEVTAAVVQEMKSGTTFTLPTTLEITLAEKLCNLIPCAQKVRFAKNGSDAASGAVRIARAFTGKDHVARCGYHGWHDWAAIDGGLLRGIPSAMSDLMTPFVWNDPASLEKILRRGDCGTVILEVPLDEPRNDFLNVVKDMAHRYGALFVMDEVVTGFRYGMGGAQEYYEIVPDLAAIGKAMGNGLPISAIVGRADVMDVVTDGCFFSGTFFGERTAMAAALTTIKIMEREGVCDKLWSYGRRLKEAIETSARAYNLPVLCHGNAVRFVIKFTRFDSDPEFGADPGYLEDLAAKSLFLQEMVKRGVLMGVPTFSTASHTTKDLLTTTKAIDETFAIMAAAKGDYASKLEGACLGAPVIRK